MMEEAKNDLLYYEFNYERWHGHQKSLDICAGKMAGIDKKIKHLHEVKNYPNSDLKFFHECA